MTGRRKRRGKPLKSIAIVTRSAADFERRLNSVRTPMHRPSIALDYLMAAWCRGAADRVAASSEAMFEVLIAEARRFDSMTVAEFQRAKDREAS